MKKYTQLLLPIFFIATTFFSACRECPEKITSDDINNFIDTKDNLDECPGQKRPIDFSKLAIDKTIRNSMKNHFDGTIQVNSKAFPYKPDTLSEAHINTIASLLNPPSCTTWPGVKIHYGVRNDTFIHIYEPVNLTFVAQSGNKDKFNVTSIATPTYYILEDANTLHSFTNYTANIKPLVDAYIQNVTVQHNGTPANVDTSKGHSIAITFPIVEFKELIYQNYLLIFGEFIKHPQFYNKLTMSLLYKHNPPKGVIVECGSVNSSSAEVYSQHHIVLTPLFEKIQPPRGALSGKAADLGGLCPPNCKELTLHVQ